MTLVRHAIGLTIGLAFTLAVFFCAGYFGAVWTHYFSGDPAPKYGGEVTAKIIPAPPPPCPQGKHC